MPFSTFDGVALRMRTPRALATRARRRLVVLAAATTLVASVIVALAAPAGGRGAAIALLLVSVALQATMLVSIRHRANATDRVLDERERASRDGAHRIAYWGNAFPVGAVVGAVHARIGRQPDGATLLSSGALAPWQLSVLLFALAAYYCALPAAIIAWREPDDVPEE